MIFVTGDIHGNPRRFSINSFPEQVEMTRDDFVIILGDFGLVWSGSKEENYWLDWLDNKTFTTLFIDGNHENFDLLYTYPVVDLHGGKAHKIRDNIYHLMRGHVFELCGKKLFAFGGASSHDIQDGILDPHDPDFRKTYKRWKRNGRMFRVKGVSWWDQEMPNEEEMEQGRQSLKKVDNKVDYVLTHCAPQEISSLLGLNDRNKLTGYLNELIQDGLQFDRWFCGHMHIERQIMGKFMVLYEQIIRII